MAKASIWGLGGMTWREMATRVWSEMQEDEILGRAAQLSYYFLLALFPLLLFLTSVLGFIAGDNHDLRADMFRYLGAVLPGEASKLISTTVNDVTQGAGGGKISFGILATLWAASNGMGAISESLNVAYDVKETRSWWKSRLVSIGLTITLAVLIISALVLVLYGGQIAETVAGKFGLGDAFATAWKILQWPVVLGFVLLAFALIYYFAPDVHRQKWEWITPGAAIGVVLWLLVSFAFRLYLHYFNSYSATYGSLGAVIILMLWFYFTGAAILIGGEINSEVEHAMAEAGDPEAKESGEKSPQENETKGQSGGKGKGKGSDKGKGDDKGKSGDRAKATGARSASLQATGASGGKSTHTRNVQRRGNATAARSFSFSKLAVVAGAWALSKVRRRP